MEEGLDVLAVKEGRRIGIEVELNADVDLRKKLDGIERLHKLYFVTSKESFGEVRRKLGKLPARLAITKPAY